MKTYSLEVSGMSCGGCVKSVKGVLEPMEGVSSVDVDLQTGRVDVLGNFSGGADRLMGALKAAGYPAKLANHVAATSVLQKRSGGCCG